jgi:hypothetical protein
MIYRCFLLIAVLLTAFTTLQATHIVGGEMRYECVGFDANNQIGTYRIFLNTYRDCHNGQPPRTQIFVEN